MYDVKIVVETENGTTSFEGDIARVLKDTNKFIIECDRAGIDVISVSRYRGNGEFIQKHTEMEYKIFFIRMMASIK